jgi:tRNA 2-thiouridine synthesizing protein A
LTPVLLDARGLLCPMPVIRVQQRIEGLEPGTLLEAVCSDPGALLDIPAWCRVNGHRVVETRSDGDEHVVVVQVGA